jgi:asparagine synthase (glutamine-hydrolysing)
MCGILALWNRSGGALDPARVAHMNALLHHRGPDDEGYVLFATHTGERRTYWGPDTPEDVRRSRTLYAPSTDIADAARETAAGPRTPADLALVGRRLAIIDLTPNGHQPMCTPDGVLWLTFNGEVYNYLELRDELAALGHTFHTTGDTEIILHAYQQWGLDCLPRMNGMWGFAIWDPPRRRLVVVRDRLGVKPMYYTEVEGTLAVSSEITPLLAFRRAAGLAPEPHWPVVRRFIDRVLIDAGDETFFAGVHRLPPAHLMIASEERAQIERYWDIPAASRNGFSPVGAADEFHALFEDSVRLRLRSDVPVGTCLSGGLDSSSVVSTAAPMLPHAMHSFSVAYDEGGPYDERRYMRAVIERYGLEAHITVPDGGDLFDVLPRIVRHQEEPGGAGGLYSQWHVMRLAHAVGIKVLLDGQGGDELLAGYTTYLFFHLNDLLARGQLVAWTSLVRDVARLHRLGTLHTLGRALEGVIPRPIFALASRHIGAGRTLVLGPTLVATRDEALEEAPHRFADRLTQQQFADITHFLPSLLRYEDKNSMAHSIEARLPFLDYRLVEFAFQLPPEAKIRHGVTKAVLRDAMKGHVPDVILARRDKVGYDTPTDMWFRTCYRREIESLLLSPRTAARGTFNMPALRERLTEFFGGRPLPHQVWRWVHLELWFRMFIDGEGAPA